MPPITTMKITTTADAETGSGDQASEERSAADETSAGGGGT
jgi:hypothetical protein